MQTLFMFPSSQDVNKMSFLQAMYALVTQYSRNLLGLVYPSSGVAAVGVDLSSLAGPVPPSLSSFWALVQQQ
jgi:hypothetical protein